MHTAPRRHVGIETVVVAAFGQMFDHGRHVIDERLSCERRHSPCRIRPRAPRPELRHRLCRMPRRGTVSGHGSRAAPSRQSRGEIAEMERHIRLIQRDGSQGVQRPELIDTLLSRDLAKVETGRWPRRG